MKKLNDYMALIYRMEIVEIRMKEDMYYPILIYLDVLPVVILCKML